MILESSDGRPMLKIKEFKGLPVATPTACALGPRTQGKVRLGVITRAGDEGLRSVLVVGATAVIQHAQRGGRPSPWLTELLKRKPPKLAAVALANKIARIAWKLMGTGEHYAAKAASAALVDAG